MLCLFQDIFKSRDQDFSVIFPWQFHNSLRDVKKWVPTISQIPISLTSNEIGHVQFKDITSEANVLDSNILGFGNSHKELPSLLTSISFNIRILYIFPPWAKRENFKNWGFDVKVSLLFFSNSSLEPSKVDYQSISSRKIHWNKCLTRMMCFFLHLWFLLRFCDMHPSLSAVGK